MKQQALAILLLLFVLAASFIESSTMEVEDLVSLALTNPEAARSYLKTSNNVPLERFTNSRLMYMSNGEFILEGSGYMYKAIPLSEPFPRRSFPQSSVEGYKVNDRVVLINSIPIVRREAPGVSILLCIFTHTH